MVLIVILLLAVFMGIVILVCHIDSSKHKKHNFNNEYQEDIYEDDPFEDEDSECITSKSPDKKESTFPYEDPYTLDPSKAIYLTENGELNEDL